MKKILLGLLICILLFSSVSSVLALTSGDIFVDISDGDNDTVPKSTLIDFETPYMIEPGSGVSQMTTGGVNNSGCLYVPNRDDTSGPVTFLNWTSIVKDKNDKTFRVPVKPSTTYKVSYKVKFANQKDNGKQLLLYYDYYSNNVLSLLYSSVIANTWNTYTGFITTGATQNVIGLTINFGVNHPEVFVDDISVYEVSNIEWDSTPRKSKTIDFETVYVINSQNNMWQEATGGVNNSGCLYVPKRDDTSGIVTMLNWDSIVKNQNDKVFRVAVKPSTTYKVSYKMKFTTQKPDSQSRLLLYYDYYSNKFSSINYSEVQPNVWTTYSGLLKTTESQNVIGLTMNFGTNLPETFVDDITVEEVTSNYDGPQTDVLIDFDHTNQVNFEQNNRIQVDETKQHDGNNGKALHVSKGEYKDFVTFLNWGGITNYNDPVFCIPVQPNSFYTVSFWMKVEDSKTSYPYTMLMYYDYNVDDILANMDRLNYNDLKGKSWVKYERSFKTRADQKFIRYAFNANYVNPEFWIDDITVKMVPPGYIEDTKNSYCEDFYNLAVAAGYATSGTVLKPAVQEFEVSPTTKYTLGINLSGKGTITLSFDKEGSNIIKKRSTDGSARIGYQFMTGNTTKKVYLIWHPSGNGMFYKDLNVFATVAVSLGSEMGYTQNPNLNVAPSYLSANEVKIQGNKNMRPSNVPNTGDSGAAPAVACLIASIAAMILSRKKCRVNIVNLLKRNYF